MQVPPELQYNQLQTKAFFSVFKQWPIEPIANGGQYWPGQVIRIFLNSLTEGVMDPYRTHLEITVSCNQQTLPIGLLQVDNSAQSFIQQLVIQSKNRQIQRIIQYSVIAAYLTDIGISQLYAEGRQIQGLGFTSMQNYSHLYSNSYSSGSTSFQPGFGGRSHKTYSSPGGIFPTIPTKSVFANSYGDQLFPYSILSGINRSHITQLNPCWLGTQPQVWWWDRYVTGDEDLPATDKTIRQAIIGQYGYAQNIRAQYLHHHVMNDYVDSTSSLSKFEVRLDETVQRRQMPTYFQNNLVYKTYIPDQLPLYYDFDDDRLGNYFIPNSVNLTGFSNLYSPKFSKGVRQPFISPSVPQCQMANGLILPAKIPIRKRTFKIPLISAVLGLLIPQSQFVLLPLRALNDVLIELTIDPFAMFTSGYNDISEFDITGMNLMQQRAFKVQRIVYKLHTYQFYTPQLDQYLRVSLTSGIAINSHFWQLGNQYQIENSQSLNNAWPVACNQQALNQILVLFYPLDYQIYSFCRKHFRLSNNITKLQLRVNMQYYPSQPYSGNAGNPISIDTTGDNSVFLEQILMSNGYMFSSISPMPRINAFNFAINERCYDIKNMSTFYDMGMMDQEEYQWRATSINTDTALGMANVHENRYVGKAAFLYSFQPYSHSKNFLTGIDCRSAKQFDILLSANPQSYFTRPQAMYIFTRSSVIFQYGKDGIVNVSK